MGRKEKVNNPNPDPASAWKSCRLHGNPTARMEIPPRSSRSCESPGRASLQPVPDEFLLISGRHHPEMQPITREGGPGGERGWAGCSQDVGWDTMAQPEMSILRAPVPSSSSQYSSTPSGCLHGAGQPSSRIPLGFGVRPSSTKGW